MLSHATADDTELTRTLCATPPAGSSLATWLSHLLRKVMSPSHASTSAVGTRRSTTPRAETASTSSMTLPQSQPPRTPTAFTRKRRPAVARSPCKQVWLTLGLAPTCVSSTGKLVRGNASNASVEGTLSKGRRDRALEGVQTLSERRNLHIYIEQKAELAVQRECAGSEKITRG